MFPDAVHVFFLFFFSSVECVLCTLSPFFFFVDLVVNPLTSTHREVFWVWFCNFGDDFDIRFVFFFRVCPLTLSTRGGIIKRDTFLIGRKDALEREREREIQLVASITEDKEESTISI